MPQSLALVLVHIIFSTKNRMAFLQSAELRSEVHAYLTGTLRACNVNRCVPACRALLDEKCGGFLAAKP